MVRAWRIFPTDTVTFLFFYFKVCMLLTEKMSRYFFKVQLHYVRIDLVKKVD